MDQILIFIGALALLIASAEFFVAGAKSLGISLKLSPVVIGVTVVAVGTSLPELFTSIVAVGRQTGEVVPGNVIGSNMANILLVVGVLALGAKRLKIPEAINAVDMPQMLAVTALFVVLMLDSTFSFVDAIICLAALVAWFVFVIRMGRIELPEGKSKPSIAFPCSLLLVLGCGAGIYFGALYTIEALLVLSERYGIATDVFGLTAVALGTSLPELAVSIAAARRGESELAVGNIVGSNIFNLLAVMGVPRLLGIVEFTPDILRFSLPLLLMVTVAFVVLSRSQRLGRWIGMAFVGSYILYMFALFA